MTAGCDGFAVRVLARDLSGARVRAPGLAVRVVRLAWAAVGGPEAAELEVSGYPAALAQCAGWLRCPVEICDASGDVVWWGFVDDVVIGERGGAAASLSVGLEGMANRVAVTYPTVIEIVGGVMGRQATAWAEDAESVAEYGARELRIAVPESVADGGALNARDAYLALAKWPHARADLGAASQYRRARVTCRGWWSALAWQYYQNLKGREEALQGNYVWQLGAGAGPLAIGQRVLLPAGSASWVCWRVALAWSKVGSPADVVRVQLCADAAGVPGTELAYCMMAPEVGVMTWLDGTFSAGVTLSASTPVWLVALRSGGANDAANHFETVIDPLRRYRGGPLKRWDGAVWDLLDPDSTLVFRLWTEAPTSDQLDAMLDAGQFVAGVTVAEASGVNTGYYRDGESLLSDEIRELLLIGDGVGRRWGVTIGADRVATVGPERASTSPLRMGCDGVLYGPHAERIGRYADVAGWWVEILGAEWWAEVGHVGRASPVFVERCEVDLEKGVRKLTPRVPGRPAEDVLAALYRGRGEAHIWGGYAWTA